MYCLGQGENTGEILILHRAVILASPNTRGMQGGGGDHRGHIPPSVNTGSRRDINIV